jgi:hypothetical protein
MAEKTITPEQAEKALKKRTKKVTEKDLKKAQRQGSCFDIRQSRVMERLT